MIELNKKYNSIPTIHFQPLRHFIGPTLIAVEMISSWLAQDPIRGGLGIVGRKFSTARVF